MADEVKILLVGNGPMGNRGCQAIEMATIDLIRSVYPKAKFIIGNYNGDRDGMTNTDPARTYFKLILESVGKRRRLRTRIGYRLYIRLGLWANLHFMNGFFEVLPQSRRCDVVLSLGGDLYAQTYGPFQMLNYLALGEAARVANKPFVIWPATLGPFNSENPFDRLAIDRLKTYNLVLCRDELSVQHCREVGISDNVHLVADPAFLLEPETPANFQPTIDELANTIGINLGPYQGPNPRMSRSEWVQWIANCVAAICDQLKRPVLFVPHVVNQVDELGNCDHHFLEDVRAVLRKREVYIPSVPIEWNARERKWLISQLSVFVGLRTHSTIAALSSGVPCGCIGYSAKSAALCDMFYGCRDLWMSVEDLNAASIVTLVGKLITLRESWAARIQNSLPSVKERARRSVCLLSECLLIR
jgi:polysaccharide pyruvyl transferase WcaK-like protein